MPGALFDADGGGIYYTTCDEAWRPDTVWRHVLGADGEDEVVFTEPDERYWVGVGMTRSRRYVEIGVGSKVTSESRLLDTQHPEAGFQLVWPRTDGVEYAVEHAVLDGRDRLLILHNDGAEDFELVAVDPADPQGDRDVLLPSTPGVRLEEVDAFERFVAVSYREGGLARVGLLTPPGHRRDRVRRAPVHRGHRLEPGVVPADAADRLRLDGHPLHGLRPATR